MARVVNRPDGVVEHWNLFAEQGYVVRVYPDQRIELYEVGWCGEHYFGEFSSVEEAMAKGDAWS